MEKKNPVEEARRYVDNAKAIGKRDQKLLRFVNMAYDHMHIDMGYHGDRSKELSDVCFRMANDIIDRCAVMLPPVNG